MSQPFAVLQSFACQAILLRSQIGALPLWQVCEEDVTLEWAATSFKLQVGVHGVMHTLEIGRLCGAISHAAFKLRPLPL